MVSLPMQGVHGHLPPRLPRRSAAPAWALAHLASSGLHPAPCSVDLAPWDRASKPKAVFAGLPPLRPLPPAFHSYLPPPAAHLRTAPSPLGAASPAPHSLGPCMMRRGACGHTEGARLSDTEGACGRRKAHSTLILDNNYATWPPKQQQGLKTQA